MFKKILKKFATSINLNILERLSAYPIHKKISENNKYKIFQSGELLWEDVVKTIGHNSIVTFVEFGVFEGQSINYFSKKFINDQSKFFGLDSFEGLPENWGTLPKGNFDVHGRIPKINDQRIFFIKGLFQNSSKILLNKLSSLDLKNFIVHYDADLYSSTLFCMCEIDKLGKDYFAIFDEYMGHECRALYNFMQSHNSKIEIISQNNTEDGYPGRLFAKIIHRNNKN